MGTLRPYPPPLAAVCFFLLLLAGCIDPAARSGDAPVQRPDDWDSDQPMLAYEGFRAHSADEEVGLIPENGSTAPPAYCGAYQDGGRKRADTCEVHGPDGQWGPWTIRASWDGRGEDLVETEQDPHRRTVVAYDEAGAAMAWWAGAFHPDGAMAIE